MSWSLVTPVVDEAVRKLCVKPYPLHPKGCPNYGKKEGCPPAAPMIGDIIDLAEDVYFIWNRFDFGGHVERMRGKHPEWSERQLACCLYWQPTARKALRGEVFDFMTQGPGMDGPLKLVYCPEACGVNVTSTMNQVDIELEWPPKKWAYQVVLAGTAKEQ